MKKECDDDDDDDGERGIEKKCQKLGLYIWLYDANNSFSIVKSHRN